MREIKFRGKKIDHWFYGDLEYSRAANVTRIHCYDDDGCYIGQHSVSPDTIGQFTGLYDKDKKPIFEGDIIRAARDNKLYSITFLDGMFYASIEEANIFGGYPLWSLCHEEESCTIVGNIYENPELLKA